MNVLIVGGSSGLGLAMAKQFADGGNKVIVTGLKGPDAGYVQSHEFDLSAPDLSQRISGFVKTLPEINTMVYAAGVYMPGLLTDFSDQQIETQLSVGGRGLIYFTRELLGKQGKLDQLITITSMSQWIPRQKEPVYAFFKAGNGQFSNVMAEDGRIGKVLAVAPSAMRTGEWDGKPQDPDATLLDKAWVAQQIIQTTSENYKFRAIKLLRQPARVEIAETR